MHPAPLSKTDPATIRRGGRPSREETARLYRTIIDVATASFLENGYGATSIDAIARQARISKRTFYHRFHDKAELFGAVVHDIVTQLYPSEATDTVGLAKLFIGTDLEEILLRLAQYALRAVLSPKAIALHRMIISEAPRFPELAAAAAGEGTRQVAIQHIAALLERERKAGRIGFDQPQFAAEQFLHMVVSLPQRRAMGLGVAMSDADLQAWGRLTVRLFLDGCRG
jgi:AcrR family transcriptional regulator